VSLNLRKFDQKFIKILVVYVSNYYFRHKSRHLCGISASIILTYSQLLFYALELKSSYEYFSRGDLAAFVTVFVIISTLQIVFPALVIWMETNEINAIIKTASKHDKLLQQSVSSRAPLLLASPVQRRSSMRRGRHDDRKGSGSSSRRRRSIGSTGSISESNYDSLSVGDELLPSTGSLLRSPISPASLISLSCISPEDIDDAENSSIRTSGTNIKTKEKMKYHKLQTPEKEFLPSQASSALSSARGRALRMRVPLDGCVSVELNHRGSMSSSVSALVTSIPSNNSNSTP